MKQLAEPDAEPSTPSGVFLQRTRSAAVTGLFLLACFYTLYFARAILLPIVLAVLLSFLLSPLVHALSRFRVPPALGSALVLLVLLAAVGYGVSQLADPATSWIRKAPDTMRQLEDKVRVLLWPAAQLNKVATQVEKLTTPDDGEARQKVEVSNGNVTSTILGWTRSFLVTAAATTMLLYSLLSREEFFTSKLAAVLPGSKHGNDALAITMEARQSISTYLITATMINTCMGILTGVAMYLLGMPNPALWGVMAGLAPFIPYLGALTGILMLASVAFAVFDTATRALWPPLTYLCLAALEGGFVTPMILGRRLVLNPVAIILSLLLWDMVWGIMGAILAVPLLTIFKILCDRIKPLSAVGEFLGRE